MPFSNSERLMRPSMAVACLALLLGQAPATAASALPDVTPVSVLKHLPAGPDELLLQGETAQRSFSVTLSRGETEVTKIFQLGFKNAIVALPDRSSLRLTVNGRMLATIPINASNAISTVPVAIPSGTLKPGPNKIELGMVMTHRVDCSIAATYELWTRIDPAQTGFVVPTAAGEPVRSVEEMAGTALAADGTTRIVLRAPDVLSEAAIARASRFINAVVTRARLVRPVVETKASPGHGPGFDVVLSADRTRDDAVKGLRVVGREDGVTFARDPATDRLVLLVSGVDEADLNGQVAVVADKAARALARYGTRGRLDGETRVSFGDLGIRSEKFVGRHYTTALDVMLPADFYPANTDRARLLIDGAYAANLDPTGELVFRVNGAPVSSLRLGPEFGGVLRHERVELPLRFFHPGRNEIAIEATTTTQADRQCDAAAKPGVRFALADSSELEVPQYAHLGTAPQIPGAMETVQAAPGGPVHLYLSDADTTSVGAGLTVLANMTADRQSLPVPVVHIDSPRATDVPGIVVAPWAALPATLSAPLYDRLAMTGNRPALPMPDTAGKTVPPSTGGATPGLAAQVQRLVDWPALLDGGRNVLRRQGFAFGVRDAVGTVPVTARTLLVAAVDPRLKSNIVAGIDLPQFASGSKQWLIVTGADLAVLGSGLDRMVSGGHWTQLQGQVASLDIDTGAMASAQPPHVLYIAPERFVLSDIRPILGGVISNNIELSLAAFVLLMTVLGLSTHVLVRRAGSK